MITTDHIHFQIAIQKAQEAHGPHHSYEQKFLN